MIKKKSIGSMILGLGLLSASSIAAFAGNVVIYGNRVRGILRWESIRSLRTPTWF